MRQSGKGAVHPNWTEQQELTLVVRVQVSWTQGRESRRTDPVPVACCIGCASLGRAGDLVWMVTMRENWWADQLPPRTGTRL